MSDTNREKSTPRTVVAICTTLCVLAILGTYLLMELNNKNTGTLLPLVTGIIAAAGAGAAWNNSKDTKRDTAEIKKQTNGPLTDGLISVTAIESKQNETSEQVETLAALMQQMNQRLKDKGI